MINLTKKWVVIQINNHDSTKIHVYLVESYNQAIELKLHLMNKLRNEHFFIGQSEEVIP